MKHMGVVKDYERAEGSFYGVGGRSPMPDCDAFYDVERVIGVLQILRYAFKWRSNECSDQLVDALFDCPRSCDEPLDGFSPYRRKGGRRITPGLNPDRGQMDCGRSPPAAPARPP